VADELALLTRFGRTLREAGLGVGPAQTAELCRAAELAGDLYWAGRATLVTRPQEIAVYDEVFARFFGDAPRDDAGGAVPVTVTGELEREIELALASPDELLREKSFADCSPEELDAIARLMASARFAAPLRRTRRLETSRRGALDLRRTLRRSFRTGGEPLERAWRGRRVRERRVVLLLDVSGSMSDYSRALVLFAHAAVRASGSWEVFCFGTRLTRLTRALAAPAPDDALRRAAAAAPDRDGGTRIGESLKAFLDHHGHGGLARGAVVVLVSDGLELGDPALLGQQAARLARLAHRVVWLNPLKGDPAYEPLARGMRAALPHVDELVSAHNLASLEGLVALLHRPPGRPPLTRRRAPAPQPGPPVR
jgi:uncharacterized protein with von Willebrand factor type A (vWA) domain